MKVGYTAAEAYQMFRSLRKEVFTYFNYDRPLSFGVRSPKTGIFGDGDIAQCDFSDDPDQPWRWGVTINSYASGIRVNADWLPYLYEDEMICVLLHELAHATAGYDAQHGNEWKRHAAEIGAIPEPIFLIRKWEEKFPISHPSHSWAKGLCKSLGGPTIESYSGSL